MQKVKKGNFKDNTYEQLSELWEEKAFLQK